MVATPSREPPTAVGSTIMADNVIVVCYAMNLNRKFMKK